MFLFAVLKLGKVCNDGLIYAWDFWAAINSCNATMVHPAMVSASNMNIGLVNPSNAIYQAINPRLIQPPVSQS